MVFLAPLGDIPPADGRDMKCARVEVLRGSQLTQQLGYGNVLAGRDKEGAVDICRGVRVQCLV